MQTPSEDAFKCLHKVKEEQIKAKKKQILLTAAVFLFYYANHNREPTSLFMNASCILFTYTVSDFCGFFFPDF